MNDTGRIHQTLLPAARHVTVERGREAALHDELPLIAEIDRAHFVMLAECQIIPYQHAAELLQYIDIARANQFHAVQHAQMSRGIYLAWEDTIIRTLGSHIGGIPQTGRSRNDLGATLLRMRLRAPWMRTTIGVLRLIRTLTDAAELYSDTVMPAYTHFQPAVPITLGHYYAGLAEALVRDFDAMWTVKQELHRSPLGACAIGGTALPINPTRTMALLGFDSVADNSVDAIASRDLVIRLLSAGAVLGVTLSRAATDLLLWCTPEFGFLTLHDHVAGSSSSMPQKRNPFLLEVVQGRSGAALGAFVAAAGAMHNTPFSNSVSVGTEGVRPLWSALTDMHDSAMLLRLVIDAATPNPNAMHRSVELGACTATAIVEHLVATGTTSFRDAHRRVGELVTQAEQLGVPFATVIRSVFPNLTLDTDLDRITASTEHIFSPGRIVKANHYGAGPGGDGLPRQLTRLREVVARRLADVLAVRGQWRAASAKLDDAVDRVCAMSQASHANLH